MRTSSYLVVALLIGLACGPDVCGEEIVLLTWKGKKADALVPSTGVRLTESQAMGIGRINSHLDLEGLIDVIETPFGDVLVDIGRKRTFTVAVDTDALKKAAVTLDQLVTLESRDAPLRKCLHDLLDPLKLDFVVFPEGLLITSAPKKAEE